VRNCLLFYLSAPFSRHATHYKHNLYLAFAGRLVHLKHAAALLRTEVDTLCTLRIVLGFRAFTALTFLALGLHALAL